MIGQNLVIIFSDLWIEVTGHRLVVLVRLLELHRLFEVRVIAGDQFSQITVRDPIVTTIAIEPHPAG
jgi:hypothetical protein